MFIIYIRDLKSYIFGYSTTLLYSFVTYLMCTYYNDLYLFILELK